MTASEAPALIGSSGDSLREAFGKTLSALANEYPKLVVLDADIAGGTGVHHFRKSHPERFIQFGIAEQNMMAAAGGLAAVGLLPVVTTFAVFWAQCEDRGEPSGHRCWTRRRISAGARGPRSIPCDSRHDGDLACRSRGDGACHARDFGFRRARLHAHGTKPGEARVRRRSSF